jgi:uncharacterized protein YraI
MQSNARRSHHRRAALSLALVAIMLAMLVPMTAEPAEAAGESWLDGWGYRAAAPINAASGASTGYQVLFHLYAGSGTNIAGTYQGIPATTIYTNGHAKAGWGDLRFTAADGKTLLPYWIESSSAAEATVWVKLSADISTAGTTVYCYYGNSAASSQSNGANVFPFFDDFDGTALDSSKWAPVVGTPSLAAGVLSLGPSETDIKSVGAVLGNDQRLCVSWKSSTNTMTSWSPRFVFSQATDRYVYYTYADGNQKLCTYGGQQGGSYFDSFSPATWYRHQLWYEGSAIQVVRADNGITHSFSHPSLAMPCQIQLGGGGGNPATVEVRWAFVRDCLPVEPSHGTPSAEAFGQLVFTSQPSVANIVKTVDGRTITASTVAENYSSIVWNMGDGTTYEGSTQVRHVYQDNGTYTVTVTASDWLGQNATTSTAVQIGAVDNATVGLLEQYGAFVIADLGIGLVIAFALGVRRPVVLIAGIALIVIAGLLHLGVL